jgi:hypothetical protein
MENSTQILERETSNYLRFVLELSNTCMTTCGILEKRGISNSHTLDTFDTDCLSKLSLTQPPALAATSRLLRASTATSTASSEKATPTWEPTDSTTPQWNKSS